MSQHDPSCEGGCTCGQVRYRLQGKPLIVHCCHCRWCQRQTGTAFALNALFETSQVDITQGRVENLDTASPSGRGQTIARCPDCKIAVWSHYFMGGLKERISFIRVGTLDNPNLLPPDVHIYTSTKQPWVILPPEDHAVEEFYDIKATWTPQAYERLLALTAEMKAANA
ncbi:GFA family protein [Maricaulis parjimensis]|uniref:GFA family protein n=1 Tax=Maricaulis parjimensis TaxID=144023 RepID=UPI00193AA1EE|nr:GFA family protein [Maricaulis parjimensis]